MFQWVLSWAPARVGSVPREKSVMTNRRSRLLQSVAAVVITASGALSQSAFADTVLITGSNSGIGLEFVKHTPPKAGP